MTTMEIIESLGNCPNCGPMYYDRIADESELPDRITIEFVCHIPDCPHSYGKITYEPKELAQ